MRFSLIVTVYNNEKYLKDCFDAIEKQTFQSFEVIIIDDGSNDDSPFICDKYAEQLGKIRVFHQKNSGPLFARRNGAKKAKGEYLFFIDSDDFIREDTLEQLNRCIIEKKPDMIIFGAVKYFEGKSYKHKDLVYDENRCFCNDEKKELYRCLLKREISNALWCKVVRRDIFDFDQDYSKFKDCNYAEDLLQSLPLMTRAESIYYLSQQLYYYRTNPFSITSKFKKERVRFIRETNNILDEYVKKWNIEDGELLASYRYMIDIYDLFCSISKNEYQYLKKILTDICDDEYFEKKYKIRPVRLLSIYHNCVIWAIHHRCWILLYLCKYIVRKLKSYKQIKRRLLK